MWFRVSEVNPPDCVRILVWHEDWRGPLIGLYESEGDCIRCESDGVIIRPTHWRPMVDAPTERPANPAAASVPGLLRTSVTTDATRESARELVGLMFDAAEKVFPEMTGEVVASILNCCVSMMVRVSLLGIPGGLNYESELANAINESFNLKIKEIADRAQAEGN